MHTAHRCPPVRSSSTIQATTTAKRLSLAFPSAVDQFLPVYNPVRVAGSSLPPPPPPPPGPAPRVQLPARLRFLLAVVGDWHVHCDILQRPPERVCPGDCCRGSTPYAKYTCVAF